MWSARYVAGDRRRAGLTRGGRTSAAPRQEHECETRLRARASAEGRHHAADVTSRAHVGQQRMHAGEQAVYGQETADLSQAIYTGRARGRAGAMVKLLP
jgi:hypothetical protein